MVGAIVKYVGVGAGFEQYPQFIGHVGYVTSCAKNKDNGRMHLAVTWFKPVVYGPRDVTKSHFTANRFEVLSDGSK
jgi:hypothetical protein